MRYLIAFLLPVIILLSSCSEEKICIPLKDPPKIIIDKFITPDWGNPEYLKYCIDLKSTTFDLNCANKYAKGNGGIFFDMAIILESGIYTLPAKPRPDLALLAFEESLRLGFPDAHFGIIAQKCVSNDPNVIKEGLAHLDMAEEKKLILGSQEQINWWKKHCGSPLLQKTYLLSIEEMINFSNINAEPHNKKYDNLAFASDTFHKACNESLIDQVHYDLFMDILKTEDSFCTMSIAMWLREGDFREFIDYVISILIGDKKTMLVNMCHQNLY
jgi:hypothetical protein